MSKYRPTINAIESAIATGILIVFAPDIHSKLLYEYLTNLILLWNNQKLTLELTNVITLSCGYVMNNQDQIIQDCMHHKEGNFVKWLQNESSYKEEAIMQGLLSKKDFLVQWVKVGGKDLREGDRK